jgi:hypothetical protein
VLLVVDLIQHGLDDLDAMPACGVTANAHYLFILIISGGFNYTYFRDDDDDYDKWLSPIFIYI